nr:PREDICTED: disintegrin and metalloproteinase domain-containing protein 9-like [Anolis carolinensis]|eukprot:XP_016854074.1 PREDICTED: disintegrin and metalloproteinase domain-containing protein 9-like [Anolis carolinensis]
MLICHKQHSDNDSAITVVRLCPALSSFFVVLCGCEQVFPSLLQSGASAAHQLGHAIGFAHDDDFPRPNGQNCDCDCDSKPGHCIMYSAVAECYKLSNCSKNAYRNLLAQKGKDCFMNLPKDNNFIKICGNGVVEGDEMCDCGTDKVSASVLRRLDVMWEGK